MIRFSLHNPLLVNLVLVLVLVLGLLAWHSMPQEVFPTFDRDILQVRTTFEGASPEEVERQITIPIEEALDFLVDIDSVTSRSQEGLSTIQYKLLEGADPDELLREMRTEIDAIEDFPEDADIPQVSRLKHLIPVISIALHGEAPMSLMYDVADELRRSLQQIPGVSGVGVTGKRDWEMWVELDPHELAARGVTLAEITAALRGNLRDTPSGIIRSTEGEILLRGMGAESVEAIGEVVVRHNAQGGQLRIRDLGQVSMQLEEPITMGRFNGMPAVNMTISKSAHASTYEVTTRVREEIAQFVPPEGVQASFFMDMSRLIETRINTVQASGMVALVLLLFSLYFLLNFRLALITAMGIPVAMLTAVIVMALLGYSINMVSMFAFLVVLGLVVDDAIIISENTHRHMEEGMEAHEAAYIGAREVMWPVLASIFTTIAAFLPLLGVSGVLGKFIEVIPVVVVAALAGSLLEAFLILPSHAAEILKLRHTEHNTERWHAFLDRYRSLLKWSVQNRYLIASATIGVLVITLAFMFTRMPYTQFDDVESNRFLINIEGPNTYGLADSDALAERVENVIYEVVEPHELKSLQTNVGVNMIGFDQYAVSSHYVQISVNLTDPAPDGWIEAYVSPLINMKFRNRGVRERTTEEVQAEVRTALKTVPGIQRIVFQSDQAGPAGADIEVGVVGPDLDLLQHHAEQIRSYLARLPGVEDVRHDLEPGKIEYQYALNSRGRELGITQTELGTAVRMGYQGAKVIYISQGDLRVPVRVLYPHMMRYDSAAFDRLPVTTDSGTVYLDEVADITTTRGLSTVRRRNAERMATITAEVDPAITSPGAVLTLLNNEFGHRFQSLSDYQMIYLGEKRETDIAVADMKRAAYAALAIIFFILAALFRSLLDPLVVIAAIPFALIGVVVGHYFAGIHLQFLSLIGMLALAGVVVNDSLILINFVKQLRQRGHERIEAVLLGSRARFRAILLTTVTTFFGVSPLIFFASGQTRFLAPMAISLGVGLLFATVLILLVLPCFYLIMDDFRQWLASLRARFQRAPA